ncbi:ATP-binding cassette domain-containing protein [Saccharopolyspora sp. NPDC000359]|uniref:ATP-binding cassette domain-containing protein n=1 Tax=Saccharopolyspora sp. NPDC000359 TaxID=3154251 RepID=UPI00333421E2
MVSDPRTPPLSSVSLDVARPRLSARGLRVRYGRTIALDGVDLDIRDGESVAVMGSSGSGKSTLLHAVAGIIGPDEGEVFLRADNGTTEVSGLSERERSELRLRQFGFVFQQAC